MFALARKLHSAGVLGIGQRNLDFTTRYNPRRLYPLVDDKLITKNLARQQGVAVPELYGVLKFQGEVRRLSALLEGHPDFVIKPAHGSGGEGVIVIEGREENMFRKSSGELLSIEQLEHHSLNILGGLYSLGAHPDNAMIEYRVRFDPAFEKISYQGVPDVRIIVFLGVPVMAMLRLPTRASDGRANLHQGAIGVGINMTDGRTCNAVWRNRKIARHPDTNAPVSGVQIPGWENLLRLASRCHGMTGLGYQGVDLVLDRDLGPLLLEVNARPGLGIQIANNSGLLLRLRAVEDAIPILLDEDARLAFAQNNFGIGKPSRGK